MEKCRTSLTVALTGWVGGERRAGEAETETEFFLTKEPLSAYIPYLVVISWLVCFATKHLGKVEEISPT